MSLATELTRVYFDPPVMLEIKPAGPEGRPFTPTYQEVAEMVRALRAGGWDARGIVVKRELYPSGLPAAYNMGQTKNWGFITEIRHVTPVGKPYRPIKVQWVAGGDVEEFWPEDLFLIEPAKTQLQLDTLFKEQLASDPPI